jgi:translation elongation factor EF-G
MFRMHTDTLSTTSLVSGNVSDMAALLDVANIPEHNHDRWHRNVSDLANAYGHMKDEFFGGLSSITEAKEIFSEINAADWGENKPELDRIERIKQLMLEKMAETLNIELPH